MGWNYKWKQVIYEYTSQDIYVFMWHDKIIKDKLRVWKSLEYSTSQVVWYKYEEFILFFFLK